MGFTTDSTSSGLNDPDEAGYEDWSALRAMGEESLIEESRLCFFREAWRFFMAGTRNRVVLFGSTKTSFPTAMASIFVAGWYWEILAWTHLSVNDWSAAAEERSSFGSATTTFMPELANALRTVESVS